MRFVFGLATGFSSGGVVIAHGDITERERAQNAMREALQQLQLITEHASRNGAV